MATTIEVPTDVKAMVITVEIDTGRVAGVQGINGAVINNVPDAKLIEGDHGGTVGFRHCGTAFYSHSSPGCVYWFAGSWRQGC